MINSKTKQKNFLCVHVCAIFEIIWVKMENGKWEMESEVFFGKMKEKTQIGNQTQNPSNQCVSYQFDYYQTGRR